MIILVFVSQTSDPRLTGLELRCPKGQILYSSLWEEIHFQDHSGYYLNQDFAAIRLSFPQFYLITSRWLPLAPNHLFSVPTHGLLYFKSSNRISNPSHLWNISNFSSWVTSFPFFLYIPLTLLPSSYSFKDLCDYITFNKIIQDNHLKVS